MSVTDILVAAPVLAAASFLLYRSVKKSRGGCHGCGGCGASKGGEALVRLRRPSRE